LACTSLDNHKFLGLSVAMRKYSLVAN